jgi:hypothetical protein
MKRGHAFVLGSGIAGLSIAEILSRNGWSITLLESAGQLGGQASRATQNWLHTGWLYAALRNDAAMLGCHEALRLFQPIYGSVVSSETLNVELGEHALSYPASDVGWFSSERVHYLYATAAAELSLLQSILWKRRLNSVVFPRLRGLGYSTLPTTTLAPNLSALLDYWEGSADGCSKYSVVRSTDAQINTRRVLDTLLKLLGEKAEVVCNADYALVRRGEQTTLRIDGEIHAPELVVLASGASIPSQLSSLGRHNVAGKLKSVSSPIVVLKRALDLPNFIRFTPRLTETVNHIKYEVRGVGQRSTIGSYDYYPAGETPDISPFANRVCKRLDVSPNDVAGVYYGTKTEFTGSLARRYNHALEQVNGNTYFAIPGKFSQFPLLVHEFAGRLGLRTDIGNASRGRLTRDVAPTVPEQSFVDYANQSRLGSA